MDEQQSQEDLKFQGQALQDAITLVSKYEEVLQSLVDRPDDLELLMEFESFAPMIADLQSRFSPHLNTLTPLAAQLNSVQSKLDGNYRPTGCDLAAVSYTLANLESEYRVISNKLEDLDRWVHTQRSDLLEEIENLAEALNNVKNIFQFSNSLSASEEEAQIFRETVIRLLTATIEELKAPAVNVGRLETIGQTLKRILKKSTEKKLGEALDTAIDQAAQQADKVTDIARKLPGLDQFL